MKIASIMFMCLGVSLGVAGHGLPTQAREAESVRSAETPAEEVKAVIKKMIVLIDERKTLELLEKYTDIPAENREKIAEQIDQDKLDELKTFLGMASKMTPKVLDDGKTVLFENEDFPRPMKFFKSGENWIMKDK